MTGASRVWIKWLSLHREPSVGEVYSILVYALEEKCSDMYILTKTPYLCSIVAKTTILPFCYRRRRGCCCCCWLGDTTGNQQRECRRSTHMSCVMFLSHGTVGTDTPYLALSIQLRANATSRHDLTHRVFFHGRLLPIASHKESSEPHWNIIAMVLISYSSFNMPSHPIHPQNHGNMKEKEQHRSLFDDDFF
jgi:hypothetical protein